MSTLGGFRYWIDPELRIIHLFRDCTGLKMARKYNYLETVHVDTVAQARTLDERGRACQTCYKREQHFARVNRTVARPGFKMDPGL